MFPESAAIAHARAGVGWHLQYRGWLTRDAESSQLTLDREDTALDSSLADGAEQDLEAMDDDIAGFACD